MPIPRPRGFKSVARLKSRGEIVQAQFRRNGTGPPVRRTKPCASARGLVAAPVKWPGSRSLAMVLKAATYATEGRFESASGMVRAARRRPVKDCPRIDCAGKLAVEISPARPRSFARSRRAAATDDCVAGPLMVLPGVVLGTAPRLSPTVASDANASTCFGTLARSLGPWVITTGRFAARAKDEFALGGAASLTP